MAFQYLNDLHCHTVLSACCRDPRMTPENIAGFAKEQGYRELCFTDHTWSASVPGASNWYAPQTVEHVLKSLPLPSLADTRVCFGCEAEYLGGDVLSLTRQDLAQFSFVAIPVNHMHMKGFVRPEGIAGEETMASLVVKRLSQLSDLDLPWEKVGIAHLTCPLMYAEGDAADVVMQMDRDALKFIFQKLASRGAGIELNAHAFPNWKSRREAYLLPYRLARDAGCRFYCASDAHSFAELNGVSVVLPDIISALELTDEMQYHIP
jgi:histidinol phosphatase-like PHP family hydrolase